MEMPNAGRAFFLETGALSRFTAWFFRELVRTRFEFREFLRQCFMVGYKSLPLIGITGFIMGLVLTMQLRPSLVDYGVEAMLPAVVSLSTVREIGPVVTALIFAGKIGSSIGAELGSMRVTEQIDAMEVSGTNPYGYLVVTRVMATTLMLPILVVLSDAIALMGAWLGINIHAPMNLRLFYNQVFDTIHFSDVLPAFVKTFFFGFAVGMVGCFKGYYSKKGTEGVGLSANAAVVLSSLLVFVIDLVIVQITGLLGFN